MVREHIVSRYTSPLRARTMARHQRVAEVTRGEVGGRFRFVYLLHSPLGRKGLSSVGYVSVINDRRHLLPYAVSLRKRNEVAADNETQRRRTVNEREKLLNASFHERSLSGARRNGQF